MVVSLGARIRRIWPRWVGLVLLLIFGAMAQSAYAGPMDAGSLKALFPDSSAQFLMDNRKASGWTSAQWKFSGDGSVSGYLFTSAYIGSREPLDGLDNGKWRVSGDKLCIEWDKWNGGGEQCYVITEDGEKYTASEGSGLFAGDFILVK